AAQHYYKKPASKLSKAESVSIVICFPNPRKRHPLKLDQKLTRKKATIQRWMNGFEPAPEWWWQEGTKKKAPSNLAK
ncbi:MAG: transglycosylase domain-containing protein, partial [Bacteroidota bacterium]|nr:transglycosylase domain-containing protein [Bacteroidota bacterium]MDX5431496.1 transglycosylase domain-containing protein [Bacteroidota bacterium]MDX5470220.1 transglycosylase domain-containing protein [Bacteroidota bacterium]